MKRRRNIVTALIFILSAALFILSCVMIFRELSARRKDINNFNSLSELVLQDSAPSSVGTSEPPLTGETDTAKYRNLTPLFEQNSDCIGWISIPETKVDYPVMHTPDEPQKYLRKNFYCEYSVSGVPFLDARCALNSDNIIIFGHNMNNGTMFSDATGYADEAWAKEHPLIEFETADFNNTYSVFAALSVKYNDGWYDCIEFAGKESFDKAISELCERAFYTTDAVPEYGKQLLTLSTCYGSDKDTRIIVIAVENTTD